MNQPTDFSYYENLITQFYSHPNDLASIEAQLSQVQSSLDGWQFADRCLQSGSDRVRFFGALTFTIKINQDKPGLSESDLSDILARVLSWTAINASTPGNTLVLRKLFSAVIALFRHENASWSYCIRATALFLHQPASNVRFPSDADVAAGRQMILDVETAPGRLNPVSFANDMTSRQLDNLLMFATTFAEDMGKLQSSKSECRSKQLLNVPDILPFLEQAFQRSAQGTSDSEIAFLCYKAWIAYAEDLLHRDAEDLLSLYGLLGPAMSLLCDAESFAFAAEFFADIFINYRSKFSGQNVSLFYDLVIESDWGKHHSEMLHNYIETPEDEKLPSDRLELFMQLVLAFGQHQTARLFSEDEDDPICTPHRKKHLVALIRQISSAQSYECNDVAVCDSIADFWDNFLVDASPEYDHIDVAVSEWSIMDAIGAFCSVSRLPVENGDFALLEVEDAIAIFRIRVWDTTLEAYELYGTLILRKLVEVALHPFSNKNFSVEEICSHVEPPLYVLQSLSDSLMEIAIEDKYLAMLFDSPIFADIVQRDDNRVPSQLRRLALSTIRVSKKFFTRNQSYLVKMLRTLSKSLERADISQTAASILASMCNWNRFRLVENLDEMLALVKDFYQSAHKSQASKQYMCAAVASLIQALNDNDAKIQPLSTLLQLVEQDVEAKRIQILHTSDNSVQTEIARDSLGQLLSMARGSQESSDLVVDLEEEAKSPFWSSEQGFAVQRRILGILTASVQVNASSEDLLTDACAVIRNGYYEHSPGPFVFPPSVTIDFIASIPPNHPRVDVVVTMAGSFISSHSSESSRIDAHVPALAGFVCRVIQQLGNARADPLVAESVVDFFGRLTNVYMGQILNLPQGELLRVCNFALECLENPEILPRKSSASFWEAVLRAKDASDAIQSKINELIQFVGPTLTAALVKCFGGNCTRGELDRLSGPFRELVSRHPASKQWIQSALDDPSFPSTRIDEKDKRFFLQQVMTLRGAAKTKTIVKDFWVACRGAPAGYG